VVQTYDSTLKGAGTTGTAAIKINFEDKLLSRDYFDYTVRIDGSIPVRLPTHFPEDAEQLMYYEYKVLLNLAKRG
jgi:hypothetical protein